ncbi:YniB family protein [Halomonas elongata]|uniref:YniB family protein n=1 Tax=Halomonas elongata TaxID=2746 RepID=UPI0038D48B2F
MLENQERTSIWLKWILGGIAAIISFYLMTLNVLWGIWNDLQNSHYSFPKLLDLVAVLYQKIHLTGALDFIIHPINIRNFASTDNLYFLVSYIVLILSCLVVSSGNHQYRELKEILKEIRRERKKQGLKGPVPQEEVRLRLNEGSDNKFEQFKTWLWAPVLAPLVVLVIAKILGIS